MSEKAVTLVRAAEGASAPLSVGASGSASVGLAKVARAAGARIHFVDLLRLLASFQMIHGHTLDALMDEGLRQGPIYDRWTWGRGMVSVAFMVAAGISFHLSTLARFEQHVGNPATVRRRFRRGAWLVMLGYLLHLPAGLDQAAFDAFQIADVLQCIGISILALEAITVSVKNPRHVVYASAALAVLMFALAPLGDRLEPAGPARFLMNYVTHRGGSLFPLTPWAGFVLSGVVIAEIALPSGTRTTPDYPLPRLLVCTVVVLAFAGLCELVPFTFVTDETRKNAIPAFNLMKLGVVLGIVSVLALIGQRIRRLPRFLQTLAGESLMIYVFHLLVLYAAGVGLSRLLGHTLSLPAALGVALGMILLTASVGLLWHRIKQRARRSTRLER